MDLDLPSTTTTEFEWTKGKVSWEFNETELNRLSGVERGIRVKKSEVVKAHNDILEGLDRGLERVAEETLKEFEKLIQEEAYDMGELLAGAGIEKVGPLEYIVYNDAPHFKWIEWGREPSDKFSWEFFYEIKEWVRRKGVRLMAQYRTGARNRPESRIGTGGYGTKMYRQWRKPKVVKEMNSTIKNKNMEIGRLKRNMRTVGPEQRRIDREDVKRLSQQVNKQKQIRDQAALKIDNPTERELNSVTWAIMKKLGERSWNRDGLHLLNRAVDKVGGRADDIIADEVEGAI